MEYTNIGELLRAELSLEEFPKAKELIAKLRGVGTRGYFTKAEFLWMCEWKSSRPRRHFQSNSGEEVERISSKMFATADERERMSLLKGLRGVRIPMASAILMLTDPFHYGVIDQRVWRVLHKFGEVHSNPRGLGLSISNWLVYLSIICSLASEFQVTPRDIDRTLFRHDKPDRHSNCHY